MYRFCAVVMVATCVIFETLPAAIRVVLIIAGIFRLAMMCERAAMLAVVALVTLNCALRVVVPCMLPAAIIMVPVVVLVFPLHHVESTGRHSCTQAGLNKVTTLVLVASC